MRDRQHVDPSFRQVLRDHSREMRQHMSAAELKLWSHLRRDQLGGLRFRRQHPIGIYVADIFCPRKNLVIEVDGDSHFEPEREAWDQERTRYFSSIGLREIRFTNVEVLTNIDGVWSAIAHEVGLA